MAPVVGVAAHVADGPGRRLGERCGLGDGCLAEVRSDQRRAGLGNQQRRRRDRREGDASSGTLRTFLVEGHGHARPDDGDVHLIAGNEAQVGDSRARLRRRQAQAHEELAAVEHVPAGAGAKLLDRHFRVPLGSGDDADRLKCNQRGDGVGGRRGIAQVAAQAGPALDLDATDQRRRVN